MDYKEIVKKAFGTFLEDNDLMLVKVEYRKEPGIDFLQVDLGGEDVSIDKITKATHYLNEQFDKNDPIPGKYMLDVGTAGAEPELETLKEALDKHVRLSFIDGKEETGVLKIKDEEYVLIKNVKGKDKTIRFHDVDVTTIKVELKI